jgi:hypothetical protein
MSLLSAVMQNDIILPSVAMLAAAMLSVILLSIFILNTAMSIVDSGLVLCQMSYHQES